MLTGGLAIHGSLRCQQGGEKWPLKNATIYFHLEVNAMTSQRSTATTATEPGLIGSRTVRYRVAAALLLALSAAVVSSAHAQPAAAHPGMGHGMGHGMTDSGMMSERMLDAVGASAEQKTQVRDLLKAAQDDRRKQHEGDQALRNKMMGLLAAPQVDAAAAEALRQQLQARRDVASKRQLQAMLDVGAVLTPEQRQKLADRMKTRQDMMQRHQRERQATEPRS